MKLIFKSVEVQTNFEAAYKKCYKAIKNKKIKSPEEKAFLEIDKDMYVTELKRTIPIGAVIMTAKPFIILDKQTMKECRFSNREIYALLLHEHHHAITKSADEKAADGAAIIAGYGEDLKSALEKLMTYAAKRDGISKNSIIINNMCLPQYRHRLEWLYELLTDEGKEEWEEFYKEYSESLYSEYLEKTTV